MSAPAARLLDISVFIARESGRPLGEIPDQVAVSVVSIGELQLGVLAAVDDRSRARPADRDIDQFAATMAEVLDDDGPQMSHPEIVPVELQETPANEAVA